MTALASAVEANGRTYRFSGTPVVVVCIDGSEPAYHRAAVRDGCMPWLAGLLGGAGTSWPAHCAMPALTNPNNLSIATGRPPAVHGITGNHVLDPATGEEVAMTSPAFLRARTVFAAAEHAGLRVAVVTAKDKLRRLLGDGLSSVATCFSAERAPDAPDVYSAELSEYVMAAGVRLLEDGGVDLLYLSLSDYVQHKHAPGTPVANAFYAMIDHHAARLDSLGAVVVLTADHGMSAKSRADGSPRVVFVEDEIDRLLGRRAGVRVVLPITDPYVAHHGALGSFANVYLPEGMDAGVVAEVLSLCDGVQAAYLRADAARRLELPADRIGDVVVLADADTALGRNAAWHDLTGLDAPLRSHGGLGEIAVPFLVNRQLPPPPSELAPPRRTGIPIGMVHNYDAFWIGSTWVTSAVP